MKGKRRFCLAFFISETSTLISNFTVLALGGFSQHFHGPSTSAVNVQDKQSMRRQSTAVHHATLFVKNSFSLFFFFFKNTNLYKWRKCWTHVLFPFYKYSPPKKFVVSFDTKMTAIGAVWDGRGSFLKATFMPIFNPKTSYEHRRQIVAICLSVWKTLFESPRLKSRS